MAKPFRFGLQMGGVSSAQSWRAEARKAEDLGYSTMFLPDHFVDQQLAPLPAIAAAAAVTSTLRVGTLVLDNDYKHPAVVAKEAATIDLLTDGRVELGMGAGWMKADYEALGLPYDRPGVRIDRFEEAIRVLKGSWADGPFSFSGEHYTITEYDGAPQPVQRPHPPLLIGGGGKRVLSVAAREADIVGVNPNLGAGVMDPGMVHNTLAEATRAKIGWVREAAGDRFDNLELQVRCFLAAVTDDRVGLAEAMAPGFGISPQDALDSAIALVGTVEEIVDLCHQRREEYGFSYVVLGGAEMEAFAPVVERLTGK